MQTTATARSQVLKFPKAPNENARQNRAMYHFPKERDAKKGPLFCRANQNWNKFPSGGENVLFYQMHFSINQSRRENGEISGPK